MAAHTIHPTAGAGDTPGAGLVAGTVLERDHRRSDLERASRALVPYLLRFCRRMRNELRLEPLFLGIDPIMAGPGDDPVRFRAELDEAARALRHVSRIGARPLPHARHEIARLAALVRRVPLDRVTIVADSVTIAVPPLPSSERPAPLPPFEIHLPVPDALRFPVFIRLIPGSKDPANEAFTRYAGHGRCWGEADALLDTAKERVDLSALVLTALVWARRNLAS
jgi:hypothetical protein